MGKVATLHDALSVRFLGSCLCFCHKRITFKAMDRNATDAKMATVQIKILALWNVSASGFGAVEKRRMHS